MSAQLPNRGIRKFSAGDSQRHGDKLPAKGARGVIHAEGLLVGFRHSRRPKWGKNTSRKVSRSVSPPIAASNHLPPGIW
jgi:hypothetical protein